MGSNAIPNIEGDEVVLREQHSSEDFMPSIMLPIGYQSETRLEELIREQKAYLKWKKNYLLELEHKAKLIDTQVARVICKFCKRRICDFNFVHSETSYGLQRGIEINATTYLKPVDNGVDKDDIEKLFKDELELLKYQDIKVNNYLTCFSDHFIGVDIGNKYYLTSFCTFNQIYPDLTEEEFNIQDFKPTEILEKQDQANGKKNLLLQNLECMICHYDMEKRPVYNEKDFKVHLRSHPHKERLAEFKQNL